MLNILKCIEIINHDVVYQELTLCFRSITFQNRQTSKQTRCEEKRSALHLPKGMCGGGELDKGGQKGHTSSD